VPSEAEPLEPAIPINSSRALNPKVAEAAAASPSSL